MRLNNLITELTKQWEQFGDIEVYTISKDDDFFDIPGEKLINAGVVNCRPDGMGSQFKFVVTDPTFLQSR